MADDQDMTTNGGENMGDDTRNDTPERNDVRAGDRFAYFQSTAGYAYANATAMHARPDVAVDAWGVTLADGTPGVMHLGVAKWWRRISLAPAAPKERAKKQCESWCGRVDFRCVEMHRHDVIAGAGCWGGTSAASRKPCYCSEACWNAGRAAADTKPKERALAPGWRRLGRDGHDANLRATNGCRGCGRAGRGHAEFITVNATYCAPCAEDAGAYVDAAPKCDHTTSAKCVVPGGCAEAREARGTLKAPPRPLTFDEAHPRAKACVHCRHGKGPECAALRDGHRLNVEVYCLCDCHPVEAKRGAKVAGKYDDHFARFENAGRPGMASGLERCSWSAMQLGRAPGIDSERVKRPVGKVRPEYLEEVDWDFVGLLDVDVRRG